MAQLLTMKRPIFSQISIGISQAEVIQILGKPDDMSAIDGTVYLNYIHTPWYDHNGADGNAEHYFVRLVGDKSLAKRLSMQVI